MTMDFKEEIVKLIENALDLKINISDIEIPPDNKMGDYAFPCFSLAKTLKKNPVDIAKDLAQKIKLTTFLKKIKQIGPYVNFFLKKEILALNVLSDVFLKKKIYGASKEGKTILLEGWQPNTHKAFHIGHIRNALVGEALAKILEFNGNKVIRTSYMGDIGAHVAKWIWYFEKFYKGDIPTENVTKWAGKIYTKATKISHKNEIYEKEIHDTHIKIEQENKELVQIWKKTRKLCLSDLWIIVKELGSSVDRKYYESDVEQPGVEIVKKLVKKGLAKYSDGAIIMDLEKYNLGVFVLLKSNGASLYSTKDIALAYLKSREYDFDESLYIVASEQDHHFRQLFKTLELIGYPDAKKLKHVSYGVVKLQEGKMSSRLGNIILYEDFKEKLLSTVENLIKDREFSSKKKDEIIQKVAFGAMKFTMLNQDSHKEIVFDYNRALSFDGETGPYCQYTYARINSILKKYESKIDDKIDYSLLNKEEDKEILKIIKSFPQVVKDAGDNYKPSLITRSVLDLCQAFNLYYHKHKVLQDDKKLEKARILLIYSVKQVIDIGLNLLGIEAPDEM